MASHSVTAGPPVPKVLLTEAECWQIRELSWLLLLIHNWMIFSDWFNKWILSSSKWIFHNKMCFSIQTSMPLCPDVPWKYWFIHSWLEYSSQKIPKIELHIIPKPFIFPNHYIENNIIKKYLLTVSAAEAKKYLDQTRTFSYLINLKCCQHCIQNTSCIWPIFTTSTNSM